MISFVFKFPRWLISFRCVDRKAITEWDLDAPQNIKEQFSNLNRCSFVQRVFAQERKGYAGREQPPTNPLHSGHKINYFYLIACTLEGRATLASLHTNYTIRFHRNITCLPTCGLKQLWPAAIPFPRASSRGKTHCRFQRWYPSSFKFKLSSERRVAKHTTHNLTFTSKTNICFGQECKIGRA